MDLKKRSRLFINLKNRRCGRSMTLYIFQRQRSAMFHADHPIGMVMMGNKGYCLYNDADDK